MAITGNTTFTALYRTNGYTVTFQSLSSSGNIAVSNQTVQNNGYPYNPSDPSKVTFGGVTYTFKGWTTSYTGSSWYLYTNQPLVTPSYQRINSNATFYAVYTTNDKSTISYTAAAGKETDFDARDFYNAYRNQYNGTLNYVTFNVAKSTYNSFEGAVYAGNSSLSHSDLTDSRFYYDRLQRTAARLRSATSTGERAACLGELRDCFALSDRIGRALGSQSVRRVEG